MAVSRRSNPLAELRASVVEAASGFEGDIGPKLSLERAPKPELGDYSTNAAMLLAHNAGVPPRQVAERLAEGLAGSLGTRAERIAVAAPGFLNVFLSDRWHREATAALLAGGETGAPAAESGERVLVEFVS